MNNLKFTSWKAWLLVIGLNIIVPAYYFYLRNNPRQGFFGSSGDFIVALLWFTLLVFVVSFVIKGFTQKILFSSLSVISVYVILIDDLIKTHFNNVTLNLFLIYLLFPVISSSISRLLEKFTIEKMRKKK